MHEMREMFFSRYYGKIYLHENIFFCKIMNGFLSDYLVFCLFYMNPQTAEHP